MIKSFKRYLAIFMTGIFLLPFIVKLEHHHDHFECKAKSEKHYHDYHEKCEVCSFEFSVFTDKKINLLSVKAEHIREYLIPHIQYQFKDLSKYSFLLRAPPSYTNSI